MRGLKFALMLGVSALAGAAAAEDATAGSGAATPSTPTEEVVITANPFGLKAQSLTSNVDAIKEEQLQTSAAGGLGDVVAGLPGLRSSSFAPGASRPVVRGLAGPRVQVLNDGLGMIDASAVSVDHQVAADPFEADRVEVVRGPATLEYGGSAIGGVVNVVDGRVPDRPTAGGIEGRATAQASSVDDGTLFAAKMKYGTGPWVVSLTGSHRQAGDYAIPVSAISDRLAASKGLAQGSAREVANSAVDLTTYGGGASFVTGLGYAGLSINRMETTYGTVAEPDVTIGLKQTRVDGRGALEVGFGPFDKITGAAGWADYTHTEYEGAEPGTTFSSKGAEGRVEFRQKTRGDWNGVVGFAALTRNFDAVGDEAYVRKTDIREVGAFTLQRFDKGGWGLDGGLRVDRRTLDNVVYGTAEFTSVSGSVGGFVRPSDHTYLGLSVSRNARAPFEVELFANGPHVATGAYEVGDRTFGTENSWSVEAAAHYGRAGVESDLHLFYADYDGFIDLVPTGAKDAGSGLPVFRYVQTGATFYGFEAEAAVPVWRDGVRAVRLEASADYVRGETDLGPPVRIPPPSVTGRAVFAGGGHEVRLEVRRVARQDRIAAFELPTDGYTLVNLYGEIRPLKDADVVLFAEARNLTDAEAREHASSLKDVAPLPGRNLRAGITYRF